MTDTTLFSRRRLLSLLTIGLPASAFVAAPAWADETFAPPKISAFTGTEWGSLVFGKTTQEGIKREWKNGRGDFRNSVELQTPKTPYKISTLFPNVEKSATLDGIVIRWRNDSHDGLPLSELQSALGSAPEECLVRHAPTRYQDWRLAFWPKSGVMSLVLNDRAAWVLLGKPEKVASLAGRFADTPSEIARIPDPGEGKAKEVVYGKVSATFDLKGITMDHQNREQDDMERDLRRAGDSRTSALRYDRGADGEYTLTIYARAKDDKDTDGRVTAHITGTTVYGKLDVSSDETFKIEKWKGRLNDTPLYRAVRDAQRSVEEKASKAVKAQGPPSADTLRSQQWHKIVEDYRVLPVGPAAEGGDKSGTVGGGLL